jgi:oligopeptide/dipeptide ABC transporter ATP-binding protein
MGSPAVNEVSFSIAEGERVGLVGESGSGKSTLALALSRLLPQSAKVARGEVLFRGVDVGSLSAERLRKLRGGEIGRVPQDSLAGLNPVISVGHQLRDALRAHRRISRDSERQEITDLLRSMSMPDIAMKLRSYPHELSGGMRQRVLIAMALVNRPSLLVADEPTTALDATVQAQLLDVFRELTASRGSALLLVSHDINVVAAVCERTMVMYGGEIVEDAPTEELLGRPLHPYTAALIEARNSRTVDSRFSARRRSADDIPLGGCLYGPRCPFRFGACSEHPGLKEMSGRWVRCFLRSLD